MIKVLSLFDGISVGKVALDNLGLKINIDYQYYSSEINKNAIKCSNDNHTSIVRVGDVTKLSYSNGKLQTDFGVIDVGCIDLIIGGSPCQSFSPLHTGSSKGLKGTSGLFYEYLRILKEVRQHNPSVKFLLENVKMVNKNKDELDTYLNCKGILINSSLVSCQKRMRYYWSNVSLTLPKDLNISFQNIKELDVNLDNTVLRTKTASMLKMWADGQGTNSFAGGCANVTNMDKVFCLTTKQFRCPNSGLVAYKDFCRFLTQHELEQAQTLPIGYTKVLSYNQACEVLGNGWTMEVIKHCLYTILNGNING